MDGNSQGRIARDHRIVTFRLMWVVSSVAASVFLAYVYKMSFVEGGRRYFLLGDDAMISMRYAYNLAHGRGFGWNLGDRVQGYTNLGWALVMAACHLAPVPQRTVSLLVQAVALLVHLLTAWYVYLHLQRRGRAVPALLAATLIAFNPSLIAWGVSGFESGLQALLVTAAFLRAVPAPREPRESGDVVDVGWEWMPIWTALAFVVRADSLPFFALGCGLSVARATFAPKSRRWGRVIAGAIAGAVIVAAVFAFQKSYYGDWLPNTARLKASGDTRDPLRGIKYVWAFMFHERQAVLGVAPAAYLLAGLLSGPSRRWYLAPLCVLGGWFCYIIFVGGDVFPLSRFVVPVLPLLSACTALLLCRCVAGRLRWQKTGLLAYRVTYDFSWPRAGAVFVVALLLGVHAAVTPRLVSAALAWVRRADRSSVLTAKILQERIPPGQTIGVLWAGVTPYLMPEYRFHDMLGKSDRRIARSAAHWGPPGHNKWDFDYSLGQVAPAAIVTDNYRDASDPKADAQIAERRDYGFVPSLWLHPLFRKFYQPNPLHSLHSLHSTAGADAPDLHDIYARDPAP